MFSCWRMFWGVKTSCMHKDYPVTRRFSQADIIWLFWSSDRRSSRKSIDGAEIEKKDVDIRKICAYCIFHDDIARECDAVAGVYVI